MKIQYYLRFHTHFGQTLWISDNGGELTPDLSGNEIPMTYLNEEFWEAALKLDKHKATHVQYRYILKEIDGEIIQEWGEDRVIDISKDGIKEVLVIDTWNHAGEFENVFYTSPFRDVLIKHPKTKASGKKSASYTHIFKVKAPLLKKNEAICLVGGGDTLGDWSVSKPMVFAKKDNWWEGHIDLSDDSFPLAYKYGVYDLAEKKFLRHEQGDNRLLYGDAGKKKLTILHDGFAHLPNNTWKGAGISIPVFSLRSKKSFGIGEFIDLKGLVDWASKTGFKLIQILPVNDTTATHTWTDSYPYAAISAFALNPVYINLEKVAGKKHTSLLKPFSKKQKELNQLSEIDYEQVSALKLEILRELYKESEYDILKDEGFTRFFEKNKHWLVPYAAFCHLRDKYGTSQFNEWPSYGIYNRKEIEKLSSSSPNSLEVRFYYFVQYHLHLQLKEATDYAHKKKIILKGDIPIGVYRYGCDAWVASDLYNIGEQAGAPPDDFAVKGQNWGFPTYNWKKMQEDHFEWWRKRFEQMSHYFDAFRIDHILGFFRIWSIPMHAVEGIMGRFSPAIPITINEFGERGIWFDHHRYCEPFITNDVINEIFGAEAENIKKEFLFLNEYDTYELKPAFKTQRQVENYFNDLGPGEENEKIKSGLFDLISNVILFEEEDSGGTRFHFRISMDQTSSYRHLEWQLQQKLKELYLDYYYRRQDEFWKKEALKKLPYLKRATNMLVCGEDLGMVPHCVPEVMEQLGILSLEIQRMPKASGKEFFHPNNAPYLSVVTPSTHDMSTIRGWWEEDREKTQRFFVNELGQWGEAPIYCEPWINRAVVMQHLYSPAMWTIFQFQDILGMSEQLRRKNPHEERINVPANPKHYWRYRLHIPIEDLLKQKEFIEEVRGYVEHSGRG